MQSQKQQNDLCSLSRQAIQYHNNPSLQVYAPTTNARKAEVELFYEDLQDLLVITPKKGVLIIIGDWNAKVGNRESPGVTGKSGLGVQNEAGQRLTRVLSRRHTGHSKHPLPTTEEKTLHMDITRWSTLISDWLYSLKPKMENLCAIRKNKMGSWLAQIMNSSCHRDSTHISYVSCIGRQVLYR